MKGSHSLNPSTFQSFTTGIRVSRFPSYSNHLNVVSPFCDEDAPHPDAPIFIPDWDYYRDQNLLEPKEAFSIFDNFASLRTRVNLRNNRWETIRDMSKVILVEKLALASEALNWCDKNASLFRENGDLYDEFEVTYDIINPFITPSSRLS